MIKRKNLDNSLIQWIMTQTGLGPGIGELRYVAPATSSTSQYRTQLESMGVSSGSIYTLPSLAEAALIASRNDIMLLMPGTYTEVADIDWDKDHTHILGLGGPNARGDHSLSGVTIVNSTTATEFLNITGDRGIFMNFMVANTYDDSGALSACNVDGWGNYFSRVSFIGNVSDTQVTTVACASLTIDRLGHFPLFEDCVIGQNAWNVRNVANQGVLGFIGTTAPAPQNGTFRRCEFLSRSDEIASVMIRIANNTAIDRTWLFDDCAFSNFSSGAFSYPLTRGIYFGSSDSWSILLKDCIANGIVLWTNQGYSKHLIGTNQPNAGTKGGMVIAASASS